MQHAVPSRAITNEWVLQMVREHNASRFSERELGMIERRVSRFLEAAGTNVRYAVDRGERAIDFTLKAGRCALEEAGVSPVDVDFLIYVGVGRGWTEPSMANPIQWQLGLVNATCFDVVDACASWLRALHIAHAYIRGGIYKRGLIVNCECGFLTYKDWVLDSPDDLEHRAAAWTIGEAATATLVDAENPRDDFYFVFKNYGADYRLCVVPLSTIDAYWIGPPEPPQVPMRFFARASELLGATARRIIESYRADPRLCDTEYDVGFGHEASVKINRRIADELKLPYEGYVSTHAQFGNTVSSTVPLGMSLALRDGRLKRGDKVLVLVGGSGITIGLSNFTF